MDRELTGKEIDRQDYVDGEINQMVSNIIVGKDEELDTWDIELIAEIRDVIINHFKMNGKEEQAFYPYIELKEASHDKQS